MPEREAQLLEARARLEGIAGGLAVRFGVAATARLLAETLVSLTLATAGRPATLAFLEDVTDDVRHVHPENWPPELSPPA